MAEQYSDEARKIKRALISVSDKSGLLELAKVLSDLKVEIISTGGTARALKEAGIKVREVSELTGFPEMMDGRVKTLHPVIHGGLLALRDNAEHRQAMEKHGISPIDMVVINLYPFEKTVAKEGTTLPEAVEQIDIGGPAMIRSAAKNWRDVTVVVSPESYSEIIRELKASDGSVSLTTRSSLAQMAFARTAEYDTAVSQYLAQKLADQSQFPTSLTFNVKKISDLRYGENPHQQAALYSMGERAGIAFAEQLSGKEMSYNNYIDADAAWQLVSEFETTSCAIIKHTNPAGVALGQTTLEAYKRALSTDPVSAFGGIVAFNSTVDLETARALTEIFLEVLIAPEFDSAALELLQSKKNLRVLRHATPSTSGTEMRAITGGLLAQSRDQHRLSQDQLKVVTKRAPTQSEIDALLFAWKVCKHTKSNAIVYARDNQTVGVGAGQMSRVDSVKIGAARAQLEIRGTVLASDAFFPFRDGVDLAAQNGITAIIQPGGSVRDAEVIAAADEHGLAMVFTGIRHFKH
jgi:phosphoribosylaminoimidazolecarboxamide formyltransferase / IMP cyclohydrolase